MINLVHQSVYRVLRIAPKNIVIGDMQYDKDGNQYFVAKAYFEQYYFTFRFTMSDDYAISLELDNLQRDLDNFGELDPQQTKRLKKLKDMGIDPSAWRGMDYKNFEIVKIDIL